MKIKLYLDLLDDYCKNYNIYKSIIIVPNNKSLSNIYNKLKEKDHSILQVDKFNIFKNDYNSLDYRIILINYQNIYALIYILKYLKIFDNFNLILFYNINSTLKTNIFKYIKYINYQI